MKAHIYQGQEEGQEFRINRKVIYASIQQILEHLVPGTKFVPVDSIWLSTQDMAQSPRTPKYVHG